MKKIKILLVGSSGRLGSLIDAEFKNEPTLEITSRLNRKNFKSIATLFKKQTTTENPFDVIIDVSSPMAAKTVLSRVLKADLKIPYIIGCTGWTETQFKAVQEYAKKAPVIFAPNFSPAVNLLLKILSDYGPFLKKWGYQPVISEAHHSQKLDSPSGTAKAILERLGNGRAQQKKNLIPVHSTRAGRIVGTHAVEFFGAHDLFSVKHEAFDRVLFAKGAAMAAKWAAKPPRTLKKSTVYSMTDVLFG